MAEPTYGPSLSNAKVTVGEAALLSPSLHFLFPFFHLLPTPSKKSEISPKDWITQHTALHTVGAQ